MEDQKHKDLQVLGIMMVKLGPVVERILGTEKRQQYESAMRDIVGHEVFDRLLLGKLLDPDLLRDQIKIYGIRQEFHQIKGARLTTIKYLRDLTNLSLKEAKDIVEKIVAGGFCTVPLRENLSIHQYSTAVANLKNNFIVFDIWMSGAYDSN